MKQKRLADLIITQRWGGEVDLGMYSEVNLARIYRAVGEHSDIAWAERTRAGMFDRFGHRPDIAERLKSIESAGWFITWRDNRSGIEEWETDAQSGGA